MHTLGTPTLWFGFGAFVVAALIVDFVVLKKEGAQRVGLREAALWSCVWVALSLAFAAVLWAWLANGEGRAVANARTVEFLTGYVIEKSLAIDNVFLFVTIFGYYALPEAYRKRALVIGIVAALVLRTAMILGGALLIERFAWVLYVFGAFLVVTGIRMWRSAATPIALEQNPAIRLVERAFRVAPDYDGDRLFTRRDGRRMATPMLLVVLAIGLVDVVFAVDSIPAIFAITDDPFIVLTSNVFAVLGLRAMFFLVAGLVDRFHLLPYGLAAILAFVGVKMLAADLVHVPPLASLAAIVAILAVTMIASALTRPTPPQPFADRTP